MNPNSIYTVGQSWVPFDQPPFVAFAPNVVFLFIRVSTLPLCWCDCLSFVAWLCLASSGCLLYLLALSPMVSSLILGMDFCSTCISMNLCA